MSTQLAGQVGKLGVLPLVLGQAKPDLEGSRHEL
jgi:hypothetical protein